MKKLLLFVLLASFSFGYGQNLSLSQLMSLRTMELDDVEMYLTQRGWNFKRGEEETDTELGAINFVYGTNGDFEYGESFLARVYSEDGTNRISIQIGKQNKYLEYLNAVKSFNPELIFTGTRAGNLVKIYKGATTTFKFSTTTTASNFGDDKTTWVLLISSNDENY